MSMWPCLYTLRPKTTMDLLLSITNQYTNSLRTLGPIVLLFLFGQVICINGHCEQVCGL